MRRTATLIILLLLIATSASAMILAGVMSSYRAPQAPNAPTGVTATAGLTQNTVNWTASAVDGTHDAATSYTLYGGTSASPTTSIYTGSATSYTHTGLTATPYYYRLTASNAAGTSGYSSPDATATPTAPTSGSLDFETASLTPYSRSTAYTINNATYAARSTSAARGGSYAMAISGSGGATPKGELVRQITLPATGTVSFERWFSLASKTIPSTPSGCALFALSSGSDPTAGPSGWILSIFAEVATSPNGVAYYTPGYATSNLYDLSSMSANTWYRLKVDLNCSNNTYTATLYNAAGTQLAQAANLVTQMGTFSGLTVYSYMGRIDNQSPIIYIDDILDGV